LVVIMDVPFNYDRPLVVTPVMAWWMMPVNVPGRISSAPFPTAVIARGGVPTPLMVALSAPPMIVSALACP
jgi:hypothetical protein